VTCECNPKQRALRCYSCTQREKKLWSKKLEKSGTKASSGEADTTEMSEEADQERIIVFHCLPCVEIINNEALLRARITCYCRHHDEKTGFRCVGFFFFFLDQYFKRWISCKPRPFLVAFPKPFRIHFRLKNEKNEVIAQGRSPPIMITDDHKPSRKLKHAREANDDDDLSDVDDRDSDSSPPPKKKANTKRPPSRGGQVETGVSTPQPVPSPPLLPTPQHPLPHLQQQQFQAQQTLLLHQQQQQQQQQQHLPVTPATIPSFLHAHNSFLFPYPTAHSPLPGPVNIKTPPSTPYLLGNQLTADAQLLAKFAQSQPSSQPLPPLALPLVTSPTHIPVSDGLPGRHPAMVGLPLLHSNNPNTPSPRSWDRENGDVTRHHPSEPKINKVIPAEGRLEGKTEVIVLGNGFYGTFLCLPFFSPSFDSWCASLSDGVTCYFGNQKAVATFCWSTGALLCIPPPAERGQAERVPLFLGPPPGNWRELPIDGQVLYSYIDTSVAEKAMDIVAKELTADTQTGKDLAIEVLTPDSSIRKFLDYHKRAKSLRNFVI